MGHGEFTVLEDIDVANWVVGDDADVDDIRVFGGFLKDGDYGR